MKGKWILILFSLQMQILDQLHSNHMQIEKMWLHTTESIYLINMHAGTVCVVKQCAISLEFKQMQSKEKALHYEIPWRLWEVVGTDVFIINSKFFLCIVDYYKKNPNSEESEQPLGRGPSVDSKDDFAESRLMKKIVSDAGTNLTSETLKGFCRNINIQQIFSPHTTTKAMCRWKYL